MQDKPSEIHKKITFAAGTLRKCTKKTACSPPSERMPSLENAYR